MSTSGGAASSELPEHIEEVHSQLLRGTHKARPVFWLNYVDILSNSADPTKYNPYDIEPSSHQYNTDRIKQLAVPGVTGEVYLNQVPLLREMDVQLDRARSALDKTIPSTVDSTLGGEVDAILNNAMAKASNMLTTNYGAASWYSRNEGKAIEKQTRTVAIQGVSALISQAINEIPLDLSTEAKSNVETVINTALEKVKSNLSSLINEAISKAAEVVANSIVEDMVDSYEARTNTNHLRSVGRYSNQAAIGGAANSSALFIGQALLESERAKDVNDYEAKLKIEIFKEVLGLYSNRGEGIISSFMQAYSTEHALKLQEFQLKFTELVRSYLTIYMEQVRLYQATISGNIQATTALSIEHMTSQYKSQQALMMIKYNSVFDYLKTSLDSGTRRASLNLEVQKFIAELTRVSHVAYREYYWDMVERTRNRYLYPIHVLQEGGNLLASASGGMLTTYQPAKQSALSGAISGAVAGGTLGSYSSNPYGVAIGAVAGGILGLISTL